MTILPSSTLQQHLIQNGSRLPGAPPKLTHWLQNFIRAVDNRKYLLSAINPAVQALKDLIESKADLRMLASAMFDEVPNKNPYQNSIEPNHVRGYQHMLELFNVIVAEIAPTWGMAEDGLGLIGLPFQAILDWPMGTPSGHAFFLREDVNKIFKVILDTWRDRVLKTSTSKCVVTTDDGGWLCKDSLAAFEKDANLDIHRWYRFQDLFECDPEADPVHWGFQSWDDFFVRQFKDIDHLRPTAYPDRPEWVVNAFESQPIIIKSNIKEYDRFWVKGQNYSVAEMLDHHEFTDEFVGGTVYQSLLRVTSYHRWTSPVSGHVVYAKVIPGTYFSERQTNGLFSDPVGPPEYNQVYLSQVATRALIFIRAPDPVGLICVLAIGIADVSTCEIASKFATGWPQSVRKGEEIGMFHYGGSSSCLLFRKGVSLAWVDGAIPGNREGNLPVRSALALAYATEQ